MLGVRQNAGVLDGAEVRMLSDFPEDRDLMKVNVISGVKFDAERGKRVVTTSNCYVRRF